MTGGVKRDGMEDGRMEEVSRTVATLLDKGKK